jgi:uncharacterized phage-associated protein
MSRHDAQNLALWIRHSVPGVTHLKLQKLAFYSYGIAAAFDLEQAIGDVAFEAWEHGPVCRHIYSQYRPYQASELPAPSEPSPSYPEAVESKLRAVVGVYGRLDAWSLRQQSHLEKPWLDAWSARQQPAGSEIPLEAVRKHFASKFAADRVEYPEYVLRTASYALDGVPVRRFQSIEDLARVLTA